VAVLAEGHLAAEHVAPGGGLGGGLEPEGGHQARDARHAAALAHALEEVEVHAVAEGRVDAAHGAVGLGAPEGGLLGHAHVVAHQPGRGPLDHVQHDGGLVLGHQHRVAADHGQARVGGEGPGHVGEGVGVPEVVVGVEPAHHLARGAPEALDEGRGLALVRGAAPPGQVGAVAFDDVAGVVGGAAVQEQVLHGHALLGGHARQVAFQIAPLVERGRHQGDGGQGGHALRLRRSRAARARGFRPRGPSGSGPTGRSPWPPCACAGPGRPGPGPA